MSTLLQDLRYAVRLLLRQPVFTLVAVLTLALGIGANTAIFSLLDAVFLRPLTFPDPGQLVCVWGCPPDHRPGARWQVSVPRFDFVREQQDVFEGVSAAAYDGFTLTGRGEPEQIQGSYVSGPFFQTLRVQPLRGRLFAPGEDQPGGPPIVIISDKFWQKHCGSDPAVLGQALTLNGGAYTVVGIVPTGPTFPLNNGDLFVPGVQNTPDYPPAVIRQGGQYLVCPARLKPGVSVRRANEAVRLLATRYRQAFPDHVDTSEDLLAVSLQEEIVGDSRPMFYTLTCAVGCVLLIACVNVANLLLARLTGRRKEIAVRAALGASRWRLARQFLTESLLLTLFAGTLGTLLALWCVDVARTLGDVIPRASELRLSGATLLFTLGVSILAGLLLGVVPALHAARGHPGEALQQAGARGSAGGVEQGRTRNALLAAQVAISLVLLTGTGLLLTSLWQLGRVHLGYNPEGVLVATLTLNNSRYPQPVQQADFFARLTERIDALPGVRRSAAALAGPFMAYTEMFYSVVGQPVPPIQQRPHIRYDCVSPGYFATLQSPMVRGRVFDERDGPGSPPVMIINETLARKLFPDGNVLGQKLLCSNSHPTVTEIVGVMADAHTTSLSRPPLPEMYFPVRQLPSLFMNVYVRTIRPEQAGTLESAVRAAVQAIDPDQPVTAVQPMTALVNSSIADRQLMARLLAAFAGLALVLAAIGIYGVTAYGVAQRTREIGIRMALGAQRGDVFRLIIGGGMKLILIGVVLGGLAALGLTRLLASLLYGVSASDPRVFAGVVVLLGAVALVANYLPARRATRIDPMVALREE